MSAYKPLITEIKKLVPVYAGLLNKGVSDKEAESFQKNIRLELPEGFLDFYKVCNGGEQDETIDIQAMSFSSLKEIANTKKMFDEILEEKKQKGEFFYWHPDWLPFADDNSYDTLCIDTTGKGTGRKGCILQRSKDLFEGDEMSIIAKDFDTFIRDWMKRVKKGQVYSLEEMDEEGKNECLYDEHYYEPIANVALKK
jgi:cell wall assembly regulator SMI1